MTPLGKCLVFNLKYPAEMDHLYWGPEHGDEEPDLHGLADAENVRVMAHIVGDQAAEQAGSFLAQCAEQIAAHWLSLKIGKITGQSRRQKMAYDWEFQGRLRVKPSKGVSIWYGAWIDEVEARIIPWLYGRGGREWEDLAMRTLGNQRAHSRAGDGLASDRGMVALACVPLLPESLQGFDVDRDPLVAKVVACFAAIGAKDVAALARPVGDDDG
jgi:hypothetical protein